MSIVSGISRFFGGAGASPNGSGFNYAAQLARTTPAELPPAALYHLLRGAYETNGWYDDLRAAGFRVDGAAMPAIKPIRTVVAPVVNFYGAKTFPEPLALVTENEGIREPIKQLWQWSNWRQNRRTFARMLALYGEVYLRCVASAESGRVHLEILEPQYVTDFSDDQRGYLTMLRIDIPQSEEQTDGSRRAYTHVELWEVAHDGYPSGRYRLWHADGEASGRAVRDLGTPREDATLVDFGIDWLPFTRAEFQSIGGKRGIGAVQLALESIIEADLSATNLHATLFQDLEGAWVLKATGNDANGRDLPPPVVQGAAASATGTGTLADGSVQVGKRSFWRLGGGQELQSVIPNIDYAAALAVLQDHDAYLERVMPELAYARVSQLSGPELSGRAIRYLLTPAVDRVAEVRANALAALMQANKQALTLGIINGAFESGIGTYESGDFEHDFEEQDVIPLSEVEIAEGEMSSASAFKSWTEAGLPMAEALKRAGYTETEAIDVLTLAAQDVEAASGEAVPEAAR